MKTFGLRSYGLALLAHVCMIVMPQEGHAQPDLIVSNQNSQFNYNGTTRTLSNIRFFMDNQGDYCYDPFMMAAIFEDVQSGQQYRIAEHQRPGLADHAQLVTNDFSWNYGRSIVITDAPDPVPSGTYRLLIVIDADGQIDERDENNNTANLTDGLFDIQYTAPGATAMVPDALPGVALSPNPVAGNTVQLTGLTAPADVQLLAPDGRLLLATTVQPAQALQLPDGLAQGLYLLRLSTGGQTATRKLLVP